MDRIRLTITTHNGQIIITPPPGIELVIDQPQDDASLMTLAEAAEAYAINRNTLAKACDSGNIPYVVRGKNRLVRGDDVLAWKDMPRKRGRPKRPD